MCLVQARLRTEPGGQKYRAAQLSLARSGLELMTSRLLSTSIQSLLTLGQCVL